MSGPFATEREARAAAHQMIAPDPGWSILGPGQNQQLLTGACERAGVSLGMFDEQIVEWLAGWEDATCAVIAGMVARAHATAPAGPVLDDDDQAVILAALDEAARGIRERAAACPACHAHPAELCDETAGELRHAEAFGALAARLAEVAR